MDAQINAYCERLGPGLWAEPFNAVTNLAFLLAATMMWRRSAGLPLARALCLVLGLIGIGSGLFHSRATPWSAAADTLPILIFILLYIFAATRDMLAAGHRQATVRAALATLAFIPLTMVTTPLFARLPLYGVSAAYMPVPLLIALYAALLARRAPRTARDLGIGAGLLMLSLTFRSLDHPLCDVTGGLGTHFLWHILNAVMLGWMIATYCRHMRAH
ncbi:ceramidase domain-containing protein [Pseudooceanicola algae]|uniref:Uncharacterized protein n=1 Tax=Pseudooceanicola algae TaxID=1537215 RepID=A0A418SHY4_9RHOB|nr:ceramidase domain-containing protein [Pseudooceanicola algae]QPM92081.1 hypothetical protein PSAL_033440 [Pseudooceanicola algae]